MKLNIALGEKQTETRNAITKNIFKVVIIWIINITYIQLCVRNFVLSSVNDKTNFKYFNIMIAHSE